MTVVINGTTGISTPGMSSTGDVTLAGSGVELLNNSGRVVVGQTGSVIQVVSQTFAPNSGTSANTTPITTGVSLAITPTSSSSKVLVLINGGWGYLSGAAGGMYYYLYKNGSSLSGTINQNYSSVAGVTQTSNIAVSWLDSPATTSATTYALYFSSRSTNLVYGLEPGCNMQMILMEIAG